MANLKNTVVLGKLTATDSIVGNKFIKNKGKAEQLLAANGSIYSLDKFSRKITFDQAIGTEALAIESKSVLRGSWLETTSGDFGSSRYDKICIMQYDMDDTINRIYYRTKQDFIKDLNLSQIFNFQGTKSSLEDLWAVESALVGDVYTVGIDAYVCKKQFTIFGGTKESNYTDYWTKFDTTVKLDGYAQVGTISTMWTSVNETTKKLLYPVMVDGLKHDNQIARANKDFYIYGDSTWTALNVGSADGRKGILTLWSSNEAGAKNIDIQALRFAERERTLTLPNTNGTFIVAAPESPGATNYIPIFKYYTKTYEDETTEELGEGYTIGNSLISEITIDGNIALKKHQGMHINSALVVAGNGNSWNEGIRVLPAGNKWSNIFFSSTQDTSGTHKQGWLVGKRGADGSIRILNQTGSQIVASEGDFTIEENSSSGANFTIHKNTWDDETNTLTSYGGATLMGPFVASIFKGDYSPVGLRPSNNNEINFTSNSEYIYFGWNTTDRVNCEYAVNTYVFGQHTGTDNNANFRGNIHCGTLSVNGTIAGKRGTFEYNTDDKCIDVIFN